MVLIADKKSPPIQPSNQFRYRHYTVDRSQTFPVPRADDTTSAGRLSFVNMGVMFGKDTMLNYNFKFVVGPGSLTD